MNPFNLTGTWKGDIRSAWINTRTGNRLDPIEAILTIVQDENGITCTMRTQEMTSYSTREILISGKNGKGTILNYQYVSYPLATVRDRSPIHKGTMNFTLIEAEEMRLVGDYYTDRNTKGEVSLRFLSQEIYSKLEEFTRDHPVQVLSSVRSLSFIGKSNFIVEVDQLLLRDEVEKAIEVLIACITDSIPKRLRHEVIVLSAWLKRIESQNDSKIISREDFTVGRNQIVYGLAGINSQLKHGRLLG